MQPLCLWMQCFYGVTESMVGVRGQGTHLLTEHFQRHRGIKRKTEASKPVAALGGHTTGALRW